MLGIQIVESVSFKASEAYLTNTSLADKVTTYFKKVDGCLRVFIGFQIQDPTYTYIFLIWESNKHFVEKQKRLDYSDVIRPLAAGSDWTTQHINFDEDPTAAFCAPITEFSLVRPKAGREQRDIDLIVAQLQKAAPSIPGAHPLPAWGPINKSIEHVMAAGWDSVEAHMNAVGVSPIDVLAGKLFELSDIVVKHITLHEA